LVSAARHKEKEEKKEEKKASENPGLWSDWAFILQQNLRL
jgi:hypothetical protein